MADLDLIYLLRARRADLAERLSRVHRDRLRVEAPLSADFAEQAVEQENDDVLDRLEPALRAELEQFDRAIRRAQAGDYGICERCGEGIDARRLMQLPQVTLCAHCAAEVGA